MSDPEPMEPMARRQATSDPLPIWPITVPERGERGYGGGFAPVRQAEPVEVGAPAVWNSEGVLVSGEGAVAIIEADDEVDAISQSVENPNALFFWVD